ncbi:MAG: acyl-CoA thioesterase II [Alphaproteobacteria bacterium]|nr:acyl-CoA thioesterase II [Alphaproteobacteria bacterium]
MSQNPLLDSLALERVERNLYRGHAPSEFGGTRIFGGHIIGQALVAAYATVENRVCHSLHAYFVRPGDARIPILYDVDRARDGSSFTTRRVAAIQEGQQILNLAASFQIEETGLEHASKMPDAPAPESLPEDWAGPPPPKTDGETGGPSVIRQRPIEMRHVHPQDFEKPRKLAPAKAVWMRMREPIGDDIRLQHAALGFASDMNLFETAMRPHGMFWSTPGLQSASLDHAVWFHQKFDFHRWHLFVQDSPIAHSARAFVRGAVWSQDGKLVASVAQEGLLRYRGEKAP